MAKNKVGGLRIRASVPETNGKTELKAKIRAAFKVYKGEDKKEIQEMLKAKHGTPEDTTEFLNNIFEQLTTVPA